MKNRSESRKRSWIGSPRRTAPVWQGIGVAALFLLVLQVIASPVAAAEPVFQLSVRWSDGTPNTLTPGEVVTAEWRLNVNDAAAAPSNDPVDNVTFTATADNGAFVEIPEICLVEGVEPASSLSEDRSILVCNTGTQVMGTAIAVQTAIDVTGNDGQHLSLGGHTVGSSMDAEAIPIEAREFAMDITWSGPSPWTFWNSTTTPNRQQVDFQWTLNLFKGSEAGPNSITYRLNLTPQSAGASLLNASCGDFAYDTWSAHPFSGTGFPVEQTASSVSCSITRVGASNSYDLTLSGINYSPANVPTHSSNGAKLPLDRDAIASGRVVFVLEAPNAGSLGLDVIAPTYTSAVGELTAIDEPANNVVEKTWTRSGGWSSAWRRAFTNSSGTNYDDSYRLAAGSLIQSANHSALHHNPGVSTVQMCTVLDTRHVEFVEAHVQQHWATRGAYLYYVGQYPAVVNGSGSYNPETFVANCDLDPGGWVTELPEDLSTVKAVKYRYDATTAGNLAFAVLLTTQKIAESVPPGTDIWSFNSYKTNSNPWSYVTAPPTTATPGARYPSTTGSRDIVRTVSVQPVVSKSVDRSILQPGGAATFTLEYAAAGGTGIPATVDGFRIVDRLPAGLVYVSGSANPEPQVSTDPQGRQVLRWEFNQLPTNVNHIQTYQAALAEGVDPGTVLTNDAMAAVVVAGGSEITTPTASASVTSASSGVTTIGKTADTPLVPNPEGDGVGIGAWTVTLRSYDPHVQEFTDTIDILPFNGDGRGTSFTGTYELTSVDAANGATVYYTTTDPTMISDDPADPSNGAPGDVSGSSVGWSTEFTAAATAVRVIGPELAPGKTQSFSVKVLTDGAVGGEVLVNRAQARAAHTELVMRTSAPITIGNFYSASLKKYVQDSDGDWRDANTVEDYPTFKAGDTVRYRIVVTNTGQGTLHDLVITDDVYPELGSFEIAELAPGEGNAHIHEYDIAVGSDTPDSVVNTACVDAPQPPDTEEPVQTSCDPAGIEMDGEPTHTKTLISAEPIDNGQWRLVYGIDVENTSIHGTHYSLDDTLRFTDQATITSAEVTEAPSGVTLADPAWDGETNQSIATNVPLPGNDDTAYAPHHYELTVIAAVPLQLDGSGSGDSTDPTLCPADDGDFESDTAFNNVSGLTDSAGETEQDQACAPIPAFEILKELDGAPVDNGDGTWTAMYDLTVTNTGSGTGTYDLTDTLDPATGLSPVGAAVVDAPAGVTTNPAWTGTGPAGDPANVIASDVALDAGGSHSYRVSVDFTLDDDGSVPVVGSCDAATGPLGGLTNTAEAGHNGLFDDDDACVTVAVVTLDKTISAGPTPNGDGTWTITYDLDVTNTGAAVGDYDLADRLHYGDGIDIVTAEITDTPTGVIPAAGWTGLGAVDSAENDIVSGISIGSGSTHTYRIAVTVTLDEATVTTSDLECPPPGTGDAGGLANTGTLESDGVTLEDEVCAALPMIELDKTISAGPTPNGDGTWTIAYDLDVTNTGAAAGDYDLADRLHYGDGIDVLSAEITDAPTGVTPAAGWTGVGAIGSAENDIVAGVSLDAGDTHTYRVTVTVTLDDAVVMPSDLDCPPPGSGDAGGLANTATLEHNGIEQDDDVCATLPNLELDKSISAGPTPNGDGTWSLSYDLVVTNSGAAAGDYDLADRLHYGDGIDISSAEISDAPAGVTPAAGWTGLGAVGSAENDIVTDISLDAGDTHTYRITVTISLDDAVVTPSDLDCPPPGSGDAGGLANTATLEHNGVAQDDDVCASLPDIDLTKSISNGPIPNGDGTWTITYALAVANTGAASGVYDLADRLDYGDGIDIVSAEISDAPTGVTPAAGWTGAGAVGSAENVIATGVSIDADSLHLYRVTVTVSLDDAVVTPSDLECPPPGSGDAGGLANTATLEHNGVEQDDDACATLPLIELDKSISDGPTPNGDGTWTIAYDLAVSNTGAAIGRYDLADRLDYGEGIDVVSATIAGAPGGVTPAAGWTGFGDAGSAENIIVTDVAIPAPGIHLYSIEVVVSLDDAIITSGALECAAAGSGEAGGLANTATVDHNGLEQDDDVCATLPLLDLDKSISAGPTPNGDGTWSLSYDLVVTNSGAAAGDYDLADRLHYGDGIDIVTATITDAPAGVTPAAGWTGVGAPGSAENVIVTDVSLDADSTHTYRIDVIIRLADATIDPSDLECPPPGTGANSGLANTATLEHNGVAQDDEACATVPDLDLTKSISDGPTPNGDGTWSITYALAVANTGAAAGVYDLADRLDYGDGIDIVTASISDAPAGVAASATWTGVGAAGSTDNDIVTGVSIDADSVHIYRVTVTVSLDDATITPEALECAAAGSGEAGGLANTATLEHNGITQDDDVCATLPVLDLTKSISDGPTPNGDGTWTLTYDLDVTNTGAASGDYDLADRLHYGDGIDIVSATVSDAPAGVTPAAGWTGIGAVGSAENVIATGITLPADTTHTYQITVTVSLDEAVVTVSDLECPPPGSGDAGGLANTATLDHNGLESDDDVCATLPMIDLTKSISGGPTPNGDGTWTIAYDLVVTNTGGAAGDYDLADRLHYGDGVDIISASITDAPADVSPAAGWTGLGDPDAIENVIVTGVTIPGPGIHVYRIEVTVSLDEDTVIPSDLECPPPGSGDAGGLANTATLEHNGIDQDDDVCATLPMIDLDKTVAEGPTPNGDGTWSIEYDLVVTNTGAAAGVYDLADRLHYGAGIDVVSATISDAPAGVTPAAGWTGIGAPGSAENVIVTDVSLDADTSHTYRVTVTVVLDDATITPEALECAAAGSGDAGGLANTATLEHNGLESDDDACDTVPMIDLTKSISNGPTPNGDGTWSLTYALAVSNTGAASGVYDLADRLHFGDGIDIVTATVSDAPAGVTPAAGWTGRGDVGSAENVIASGVSLDANSLHLYRVTVTVSLDEAVVTASDLECPPPGSGEAGGLANTASLEHNGLEQDDDACATLPNLDLTKSISDGPTPNGDGTWTIAYDLVVSNSGPAAGDYDLADRLHYGEGVDIVSASVTDAPAGVTPAAGWTGVGGPDAVENVIATGVTIPGPGIHVYRIEAVVSLDDATITPGALDCAAAGSGETGGLANTATLEHNGLEQDDGACATLPLIDITKAIDGAVTPVAGQSGQYDLVYEIVVANRGGGDGSYDLDDALAPGDGITIVGVQDVTTDFGAAAALNPGFDGLADQRINTDQVIDGATGGVATEHRYRVTVRYAVDLAGIDLPEGGACAGPAGTVAGALNNTATVTWNGAQDDDEACVEVGKPTLDKTLVSAEPVGSGRWEAVYDLTVGNTGFGSVSYSLDDDFHFATDIDIADVTVTGPAGVTIDAGFDGADNTRIATDIELLGLTDDAYEPHVYRITVLVDVPLSFDPAAVDDAGNGSPACTAPAGDNQLDQGLNNVATLTDEAGNESTDTDCAALPSLRIDKSLTGDAVRTGDGAWTIAYDITVTNDGAAAGTYELFDQLRYGTGISVAESRIEGPEGIDTSSTWTGLGASGADENRIVTDVALDAGEHHVYRIEIDALIDADTVDDSTFACPDPDSDEAGGFSNIAGIDHNDHTATDTACAPPTPEEPPAPPEEPPAPPTTTPGVPTPPGPSTPAPPTPTGPLPVTGADLARAALIGLLLLTGGALLTRPTRAGWRRHSTTD